MRIRDGRGGESGGRRRPAGADRGVWVPLTAEEQQRLEAAARGQCVSPVHYAWSVIVLFAFGGEKSIGKENGQCHMKIEISQAVYDALMSQNKHPDSSE